MTTIVEKVIFEYGKPGVATIAPPDSGVPNKSAIPSDMLRADLDIPDVNEVDVIRHYTKLSTMNFGVDSGFYPLGSCTMKYNPKVNEEIAKLAGFTQLHPYSEQSQGTLKMLYEMQQMVCELTGMQHSTIQPAAGAHGELTGMMMVKAFHKHNGDLAKKRKILEPDTSHGTNPASLAICGFEAVEIKSNARGGVDIEDLKAHLGDDVAGLMLTNPNTLGLFDENIAEITKMIHEVGGLNYYDGANMNANMGKARPGDMGFDVIHINVHKTLATPHGGGGPGAGPVGVVDKLKDFLPVPVVVKNGNSYSLNYNVPHTIGKVRAFAGSTGVLLKSYAYMKALGAKGLREASENAVLNANYMMHKLKPHYHLAYDRVCKHEFVIAPPHGFPVTTLDIAKRLIDYGYHPPTIYFPHLVHEGIMIEPNETESKETLDAFIDAMLKIKREGETHPELLKNAPSTKLVGRLDGTLAARQPDLRWRRGSN